MNLELGILSNLFRRLQGWCLRAADLLILFNLFFVTVTENTKTVTEIEKDR